jgi:hypothetical protein
MTKINILKSAVKSKKKTELLDKIKNNDLTVKFTMNMPVNLHQDLKILAAKQRINMVDIVLPILDAYIQKNA